jgi:superfamily II DNA helicase RecQ
MKTTDMDVDCSVEVMTAEEVAQLDCLLGFPASASSSSPPAQRDFNSAMTAAFLQLGVASPHRQQLVAVTKFIQEEVGVFAQLPTGFGKSACFQVLPLIFDSLAGSGTTAADGSHSFVLVICPLISIIDDQVRFLTSAGVVASSLVGLQSDLWEGVVGKSEILFSTPEALLGRQGPTDLARKHLGSPQFQKHCVAFVIDEAHCVVKWENEFRPLYDRLDKIHDLLVGCRVMALTATATQQIVKKITTTFMPDGFHHVKEDPSRSNITLTVKSKKDLIPEFVQLLKEFLTKQEAFPRTVIFFHDFSLLGEIQQLLMNFTTKIPAPRPMFASFHSLRDREKLQECLTRSLSPADFTGPTATTPPILLSPRLQE